MEKVTRQVAISFQFFACKSLKTLYLFVSLEPVILNTTSA
jgi:hypothetical protein